MSPSPALHPRLLQLRQHLDHGFDLAALVTNIEQGRGNVPACAQMLADHALAQAMWCWFAEADLDSARQWAHTSARLQRWALEKAPEPFGALARVMDLRCPLLSNDRTLIAWFASHEGGLDPARMQQPGKPDFLAYQTLLALRGDWTSLQARCEQAAPVIAAMPRKGDDLVDDHAFFAALCRRDEASMRTVLEALLTPKRLRGRDKFESGYTSGLLCTPAFVYAKIAWLAGCELALSSPLVPGAWLPVAPPTVRGSAYAFLDETSAKRQ